MTSIIALRPPSFSTAKQPVDFQSPSIAWLSETWHVTHSTLPMWKTKRNVKITYSALRHSQSILPKEQTDRLDDQVTYQTLESDKFSTVRGIDTAALSSTSDSARHTWDWRGKGWLRIISSHWELLGWGEEAKLGNKWAVTIFAKTWFTPAGIDIYSQKSSGLAPPTLQDITTALSQVDDFIIQELASELFEVRVD